MDNYSQRVQYFAWLGGRRDNTLPGVAPAGLWGTSGWYAHSTAWVCYTPNGSLRSDSKRLIDDDHRLGIQNVDSRLQWKESTHTVSNTVDVYKIFGRS